MDDARFCVCRWEYGAIILREGHEHFKLALGASGIVDLCVW